MSRLSLLPAALRRSLEQRSSLKVIAGLMNFDADSVTFLCVNKYFLDMVKETKFTTSFRVATVMLLGYVG